MYVLCTYYHYYYHYHYYYVCLMQSFIHMTTFEIILKNLSYRFMTRKYLENYLYVEIKTIFLGLLFIIF